MATDVETVEWLIVGGGVAGLASVLSLTGQFGGQKPLTSGAVVILDSHRLAHGASLHNPGRGQGGFHYPDPKSAKELQDVLIYNLTHYTNWFNPFFSRQPNGDFVQSWYAVLPDGLGVDPRSFYSNAETVDLFEGLAERWEAARVVNPALSAVGDAPFMQWVDPGESTQTLGTDRYFKVARTLEPNLDVAAFVASLRDAALSHPQVSALEHDVVLSIVRLSDSHADGARFEVTSLHDGRVEVIHARNLNVCAWEATESLLAPLGYQFDTLNRIKCGFDLRLAPDSVDFPSTIAVYGSHAMIRNYYDGSAFCTVADITNVVTERIPDVGGELEELIAHKHDKAHELAAHVREELNIYYPGLSVEEVSDPKFGVVKVFSKSGKIDLNDPHGDQNYRQTDGLSTCLEPGLWMTWSMKLVSCFRAAEQFRESVVVAQPKR